MDIEDIKLKKIRTIALLIAFFTFLMALGSVLYAMFKFGILFLLF